MQELEAKIIKEGKILSSDILKVGTFLNQQIDTDFMFKMGREIARLFEHEYVTKVLTIEASGIALALAAAHYLHVPVVFAKKSATSNLSGDVYTAKVHSFTHNCDFEAIVPIDYLSSADTVLIADDFLAEGNAIEGLSSIVKQSGAHLAGAAIAIEKGFQGGGDSLREKGMRVESLAIIDGMNEQGITFRDQNN